jgi:hypothetical protein
MAEPIPDAYKEKMNRLAQHLDTYWNGINAGDDRRIGFTLFVYEFGKVEGARINYISNGARDDMIKAVREWLGRVEGG